MCTEILQREASSIIKRLQETSSSSIRLSSTELISQVFFEMDVSQACVTEAWLLHRHLLRGEDPGARLVFGWVYIGESCTPHMWVKSSNGEKLDPGLMTASKRAETNLFDGLGYHEDLFPPLGCEPLPEATPAAALFASVHHGWKRYLEGMKEFTPRGYAAAVALDHFSSTLSR